MKNQLKNSKLLSTSILMAAGLLLAAPTISTAHPIDSFESMAKADDTSDLGMWLTANGKINGDRDDLTGATGPVKRTSYKPVPSDYSLAKVQAWIAADQKINGTGWKYVYVPIENAGDKEMANNLRVAVLKAWNGLSWKPAIDLGRDASEGTGLVLALNPTTIWDANADKFWAFIANCSPKSNIRVSPAPRGECDRFGVNEPVTAPRFVFNATNGGPYANVMQTPPDFSSFRRKFKMDPIQHTSTHKQAIVCGPRITGYTTVNFQGQKLVYSFTTDEFDGRDEGDIAWQRAPTDKDIRSTGAFRANSGDEDTAVASEWWMQLPNGMIYYGIHGEGSQERGKAEVPFAIDPANWTQDYTLANGRSCIACHANGVQAAPTDADKAGTNGWSSNEELTVFYATVREKFQGGMRKMVEKISDGDDAQQGHLLNGTTEPVTKALMLVEGKYQPRSGGCSFFCNGKYGSKRQNLCETLPAR